MREAVSNCLSGGLQNAQDKLPHCINNVYLHNYVDNVISDVFNARRKQNKTVTFCNKHGCDLQQIFTDGFSTETDVKVACFILYNLCFYLQVI